jgi:hypothetical protein
MKETDDDPMRHPKEQPVGTDDSSKFGRLLLVLVLAVALIGVLTLAAEAYFSRSPV